MYLIQKYFGCNLVVRDSGTDVQESRITDPDSEAEKEEEGGREGEEEEMEGEEGEESEEEAEQFGDIPTDGVSIEEFGRVFNYIHIETKMCLISGTFLSDFCDIFFIFAKV